RPLGERRADRRHGRFRARRLVGRRVHDAQRSASRRRAVLARSLERRAHAAPRVHGRGSALLHGAIPWRRLGIRRRLALRDAELHRSLVQDGPRHARSGGWCANAAGAVETLVDVLEVRLPEPVQTQTVGASVPSTDSKASVTSPGAQEKPSRAKWWVSELTSLAIVLAAVTAARSSLADHYYVPSGSMQYTLMDGDRVIVNKMRTVFAFRSRRSTSSARRRRRAATSRSSTRPRRATCGSSSASSGAVVTTSCSATASCRSTVSRSATAESSTSASATRC